MALGSDAGQWQTLCQVVEWNIDYDINITQDVFADKPQIFGGDTYSDTFGRTFGKEYTVKGPSEMTYVVRNGKFLTPYTFGGWMVNKDSSAVWETGKKLTPAELDAAAEEAGGIIQLDGLWTAAGMRYQVNFFVNLDGSVLDYNGSDEDPVTEKFTDLVFATMIGVEDTGLTVEEDLVVVAHNYKSHFGKLSKLRPGDAVTVTDMDWCFVPVHMGAPAVWRSTARKTDKSRKKRSNQARKLVGSGAFLS